MLTVTEDIACEHVQVAMDRYDRFLANLTNCGALFLGPRTNVADVDEVIGPTHTPPTKKAGRSAGGLRVGKSIKTRSDQEVLIDETVTFVDEHGPCLCLLEGFPGHAE